MGDFERGKNTWYHIKELAMVGEKKGMRVGQTGVLVCTWLISVGIV